MKNQKFGSSGVEFGQHKAARQPELIVCESICSGLMIIGASSSEKQEIGDTDFPSTIINCLPIPRARALPSWAPTTSHWAMAESQLS